ncbi:hypothetical protein ACP4OV_003107 [Aristida adscensionis]
MEEHLSVRNATRTAAAWAASPVGRLTRIEVLVTISGCLLAVLVLLGSGRRASRSTAYRLAVWSALMLSYQAVSYTIGLMQSASFRNELIVAWGCFLLLLLGCADGIAAYSLDDSDQQARSVLNQALQLVYVFLLLLSYVGTLPFQLKVALLLLWSLSAVKLGMRLRSFLLASRDRILTVDNKFIADYMLREHDSDSGRSYDAATMAGYHYVVTGRHGWSRPPRRNSASPSTSTSTSEQQHNKLVTLDLVWQCKGKLLSSDDSATRKRKDLCLSFAMFKLLLRRLGGYPLHEACLNKTRDFVKVGLLGGGGGGGHGPAEDSQYRRMYRVVEVELGFLFDFFYARYPSPDTSLVPDTLVFAALVATSLSTLCLPALVDYRAGAASRGDANTASTGFDIWLTRLVIILFIILESFQYLTLLFSDWNKVKMLCRYVGDERWQKRPLLERLLRFMCHVRLTRYWNNSVGQYCLLRACFQSERSYILRMPLPGCISGFLTWRRVTHHKELTAPVKRAIYRFLKSDLTRIRNGQYTLAKNRLLELDSFYWVTAQESTVQSMLLWHIATTICHYRSGRTARDAAVMENHKVATTLSAYCAYLMSSAPELLPDHSYDTQLLFDAVQARAQKRLRDCRTNEDIYTKLKGCEDGDDYEVMLADGNKLGDEVEKRLPDPATRWKMLADLWVEMLLSVAPSNNVNAHVRMLATGGELITHLWVLLTHAGIIEKPVNRYQRMGP